MTLYNDLTEAERGTLDTARQFLGDNLSDFLLSGLGETDITHRRVFTARNLPQYGDEIAYRLEMINDTGQGLPAGRDPLVLAVLLDILWEHQPRDGAILFRESDVLEKLGWPRDGRCQELSRRALENYAFTAYCLIDPAAGGESGRSRFINVSRLLAGYEMDSPLYPLKRRGQPKFSTSEPLFACAHFQPGLIHDVISKRKTFLGIDFQRLSEIQET